MEIEIKVNDETKKIIVSCIGEYTLTGTITKINETPVKKVTIVFPQTTTEWKIKNGHARDFIIYEHNIPLLIQDILRLQRLGIEIEIEMPETVN
jgi:hypothetical protein